jgi:[acyl-carrier-protein] S-malonyltransferase
MAAGHSLGELGALHAAGVLSLDDALRLVVLRGKLMAEADDSGSMLALLGGTPEDARAIAAAAEVTVANDNAPGQVVLSGDRAKLAEAEEAAREYKVRAMPLDVAGAFHSPSMQPTAAPFTDVRAELTAALTSPVRWRETFQAMLAAGAEDFVETGPGNVLSKLARRITKEAAHA